MNKLLAGAILLQVSVVSLGCTTPANHDENANAPHGRLRVADGKLLDGDGVQLTLKGLSLGASADIRWQKRWNEKYFADAKSWGAELVRLPINPSSYRDDPEQTLADLDDAAAWCRQHGLYLIIDYHVIGNVEQGIFEYPESTATTWPELLDFWTVVSARYADDPIVAFYEIYNEPSEIDYKGGSWDFADWRQHADEIVGVIRHNAPKTIPLVGGLGYASDYSDAGDVPFASPDIALTAHPYPGLARSNRRETWDAMFGHLADRYPLVFTEVGFDPYDLIQPKTYRGDLEYGRELMQYAEEKQISWAAFVFFNSQGWPMPLFSDWDTLEPTLSGLFFKDLLAGKGIATAGDGFDGPSTPEDPPGNGPSNLTWYPWGPDYEWLEPLTTSMAAVRLTGSANNQSGLSANLQWEGLPQDLSQTNQLAFDGEIAEGSSFSVSLGRQEGSEFVGCSWDLTGTGKGSYVIDLTQPEWCGPTACFDMQASTVNFLSPWTTTPVTIELRIESLTLGVDPTRALPQAGRIGTAACD